MYLLNLVLRVAQVLRLKTGIQAKVWPERSGVRVLRAILVKLVQLVSLVERVSFLVPQLTLA